MLTQRNNILTQAQQGKFQALGYIFPRETNSLNVDAALVVVVTSTILFAEEDYLETLLLEL